MPETSFIIIGPFVNDEVTYWNVTSWGWDTDYKYASHFPREILKTPLPPGWELIIEVDEDGETVSNYTPIGGIPHKN